VAKALNLGVLSAAGSVADGFVLTTQAKEQAVASDGFASTRPDHCESLGGLPRFCLGEPKIKAWMALTQGDYHGVLGAVKEGLAATRTHVVPVQLPAQAANTRACLGSRGRVDVALDQG